MNPALPAGCVIGLLGAESTGKTGLAHALATRLQRSGVATTLVPEYLREWCHREGRTPRPHEQAEIAAEQTRRIADAATRGVAVADTTALMTAVYSDLLFGDRSLYADALAAQRRYTFTLLTALDLPWVADGLQRDGAHVRERVDSRLRTMLIDAGLAFAVVYGEAEQRLANAWNAIASTGSPNPGGARSVWRWPCDTCSDSACEHRLFRDLLARRS